MLAVWIVCGLIAFAIWVFAVSRVRAQRRLRDIEDLESWRLAQYELNERRKAGPVPEDLANPPIKKRNDWKDMSRLVEAEHAIAKILGDREEAQRTANLLGIEYDHELTMREREAKVCHWDTARKRARKGDD